MAVAEDSESPHEKESPALFILGFYVNERNNFEPFHIWNVPTIVITASLTLINVNLWRSSLFTDVKIVSVSILCLSMLCPVLFVVYDLFHFNTLILAYLPLNKATVFGIRTVGLASHLTTLKTSSQLSPV